MAVATYQEECGDLRPILLSGKIVRLEPLRHDHAEWLAVGAELDPSTWQYLFDAHVFQSGGMHAYVQHLLDYPQSVPFAVIHKDTGLPVGVTRFLHIDKANETAEIASWYALDFRGRGVNTEAKHLLLQYAFDVTKLARIEFNIDKRNRRSRESVRKLGAKKEAKLRKKMRLPNGYRRTCMIYAITDARWHKKVRARIEALLREHAVDDKERDITVRYIENIKAQKQLMIARDARKKELHEQMMKQLHEEVQGKVN